MKRLLKPISMSFFVMYILTVLVIVILTPMAWAGGDLPVVKYRTLTDIVETDYNKEAEFWGSVDIEKNMRMAGDLMGERYPTFEILEIDGRPWQESEWADLIMEHLTFFGEIGSYFARHPELMEIAKDHRFNGKGAEVWNLFSQGKSVEEIKQILLKDSENQPDNGATQDEPTGKELPPPQAGEISVVLYLNQKEYSVARDGNWLQATLDTAPVYDSGRTMVPLRGVMEQFGANVDWLPENKQIKVQHGDKEVILTLGSTEALVNGEAAQLDVPAKVVNGRTLIPLRFVSEQIGMNVAWEGKTQSITIKQKNKI